MASTASSSNTSTIPEMNSRTDPGPLPSKRGEIGYVEGVDEEDDETGSTRPEITRPARHPADRDTPATSTDPSVNTVPSPANTTPVSPSSATLASAENSVAHKKSVLCFLKSKKVVTFGGCRLTTCLTFLSQIIFAGATIAGWVIVIKHITRRGAPSSGSSIIFIHVIFGIAVLSQLLFIERRIFRLRAERYSHLHPGEILPSVRHRLESDDSIAFSPWNRPPLPTYAAALAQNGVGTGDVEDHLIAVPPPPAYGNTRGSTMLLSGYLRDSLRAQRPISGHSQMSQRDERPISYVSKDGQWEEIQDAERARRLEDTLARLERPQSRS